MVAVKLRSDITPLAEAMAGLSRTISGSSALRGVVEEAVITSTRAEANNKWGIALMRLDIII